MKATRILIAILTLAVVVMAADAIATDLWTWHGYRAEIAAKQAEIDKLESDLLEYRRTVTRMTAAQ